MTIPTFIAAGTGSGVTGNPTPAYPGSGQAGDLLLLHVTVRDGTNTPTTPSGWNLLFGPDAQGSIVRSWIYSRIADGSETGTVTVTIGGTVAKLARIYRFRGTVSSSFSEGGAFTNGTVAAISAASVTTSGADRLCVAFVFVSDDNAVGAFTGESGGDWVEAVAEFTTTQGSDGCIQLQTADKAASGSITGGSFTMAAADSWGVRAFALISPTSNPLDMDGTGSVAFSSSATIRKQSFAASGSVSLGSSATISIPHSLSGGGAVAFSGSAALHENGLSGSGSASFVSSASLHKSSMEASGSLSFSGAATLQKQPFGGSGSVSWTESAAIHKQGLDGAGVVAFDSSADLDNTQDSNPIHMDGAGGCSFGSSAALHKNGLSGAGVSTWSGYQGATEATWSPAWLSRIARGRRLRRSHRSR